MNGYQALQEWRTHRLPAVHPADWTPEMAALGIDEFRRLRGALDAAQALLVGVIATKTGRDTKAMLARTLGISASEAAKAERIAEVVDRVPGAAEALTSGEVSADHLRPLALVKNPGDAADLLSSAGAMSPEDFTKTVEKFRINQEGEKWRDRQRARRTLAFFNADDGCVGIRAILPSLDGSRVKSAINALCDEQWRLDHPDRAETVGGHDDEPRERRMADALVKAVLGTGTTAGAAGGGTGAARGGSGAGGRPTVIITVDAETLDADIVSHGPVPVDDIVDLVNTARCDLYALIRDATGVPLKFGRDRRFASFFQKLVLAVRDRRCSWPGCNAPWERCDADHDPPFEHDGRTDIDSMRLLCKAHHSHRHETGENVARDHDGRWGFVPVNSPLPPHWSSPPDPPGPGPSEPAGNGAGAEAQPRPSGPPGQDPAPTNPPGSTPPGSLTDRRDRSTSGAYSPPEPTRLDFSNGPPDLSATDLRKTA